MYAEVLHFWFDDIDESQWWIKDNAFDQLISHRFAQLHSQAAKGECYAWRSDPKGRLAEIIVLDQFSRNMFRDQSASFTFDGMALALAQEAVAVAADKELSVRERAFLYMPYMQSESLLIHNLAVALYEADGLKNNLGFELKHKLIIEKFGRYPHRNDILGRVSSAEELAFLQQEGSGF